MKPIFILLTSALIALVSSCASSSSDYAKFTQRKDYKKTYDVYKDDTALAYASSSNTRLVVDISDQRIKLKEGDKVLMDAPCTTGKSGKSTPKGTYSITQRTINKRSTIFGSCYKHGRKVCGGDRRKCRRSYNKYVGAPLPYWMRLGSSSNGIHYSKYVKRYPGSNGCVRVPLSIAKTLYNNTVRGTRVTVEQ